MDDASHGLLANSQSAENRQSSAIKRHIFYTRNWNVQEKGQKRRRRKKKRGISFKSFCPRPISRFFYCQKIKMQICLSYHFSRWQKRFHANFFPRWQKESMATEFYFFGYYAKKTADLTLVVFGWETCELRKLLESQPTHRRQWSISSRIHRDNQTELFWGVFRLLLALLLLCSRL